jgi:hypothetical protein
MLDFQLTQVQLRFAARQQTDAGSIGGEAHCQAFADAAPGPSHQYRDSLEGVHYITLVQIQVGGHPPNGHPANGDAR